MSLANRLREWLERSPWRLDAAAILLLSLLWAFYFWRVLTPNPADQVSLPEGDYSGQFLSFGAYQSRRLMAGEIPLWNPYNYAGHPFIADTQAAVFYPPRLITIAASHWFFSGWNYTTLQTETIAHFWLASLFMYLFVRSVTRSALAGAVSAIIVTYGGYLTGYPPLQLAVLEAGIWLPLGLLGIYRASKPQDPSSPPWRGFGWHSITALAFGVSLLAGHPQTSLFSLYVLLAYIVHRAVQRQRRWMWAVAAAITVVALGFGLASVQVLPGLEYTRLTTRSGYGFDQLANGFPFSDLIGIVLPKVLSVWSPLYSGIAAIALAGIAVLKRMPSARFWLIIVLVALGLSFGGSTVLYHLIYLLAPGFAMFRGQERAAFVIAHGMAILAGLGVAALRGGTVDRHTTARALGMGAACASMLAAGLFIVERAAPRSETYAALQAGMFFALIAVLTWLVIGRGAGQTRQAWWPAALIALLVFDLYSVTMNTNWEPVPASERTLLTDLVPHVLEDDALYRVDGRLGLGENYGTLVGLQDIRGTSPLRLETLDSYLALPSQARVHDLLNVKYVFTDWQQLEVPSDRIAQIEHSGQTWYLHRITKPAPRAWMVYAVMVTPDRGQALGWLSDPSFAVQQVAIVEEELPIVLPPTAPENAQVSIDVYAPEYIELSVDTPANGLLVLSELNYPGWTATVDDRFVRIWQADAGLRALPLEAGHHTVIFEYRPLSVRVGMWITLMSLVMIAILAAHEIRQTRRRHDRMAQ